MKCTSRRVLSLMMVMILSAVFFGGCGQVPYAFPYDQGYDVTGFRIIQTDNPALASPFAKELCIVTEDILNHENVDMSEAGAAVLMDVARSEVLYSKNAHQKFHPASLTKVMTALLAIKYGSMDKVLTANAETMVTEDGAQLLGLNKGDSMTLAQALRIMLINSANDVAMLVAQGVGGTVDEFIDMMNNEAKTLGATNTHFMNPHGLTDEDHYSTAYDLYLIFNEAIKYDVFREIINMSSYETVYYDKQGNDISKTLYSTNRYFAGEYKIPERITLIGGKTGTTNAAGHCLILLSRDTNSDMYVSVILNSSARAVLYQEMTDLLDEIGK